MQALNSTQQAALDGMGIVRWQRRAPPKPPSLQLICDGVPKPDEKALLDAMLYAIGWSLGADAGLITTPQSAVTQARPSAVWLVLGADTAAALLGTQAAFDDLRGQWHTLGDKPTGEGPAILVTQAPAVLLREPLQKAQVWAELRSLKRKLRECI